MRAVAQAHANIALVKYWGKRGPGNAPATPSIGLCLKALTSITSVTRIEDKSDIVILDDKIAVEPVFSRIVNYLDIWRNEGLIEGWFHIESRNDFPTSAGLASSSGGFAALAMALSGFALHKRLSEAVLSRLARRGSGSAARSIPGGLCTLDTADDPAAKRFEPNREIPFAMAVCLVDAPAKEISSTQGMEYTAKWSPYREAWETQAINDFNNAKMHLRKCFRSDDPEEQNSRFQALGSIVESNCMAMHGCIMASQVPIMYWEPATVAVIQAVRNWRKRGVNAYFTIDAGPHVAILCLQQDLPAVTRLARETPGVKRVIPSLPGGPARLLERP